MTAQHEEIFREGVDVRDPDGVERSRLWRLGERALPFVPGLVLIGVWEYASGRFIRETYVSKPSAIVVRLYELFSSGSIYADLKVTAIELVCGYVLGAVAGILIGYLLARSKRLARIFEPYIMAFYGIPKIALTPLFVIWFGIGLWSKVALAGTMVFFLLFYNVFLGARSVDQEIANLARVMGANERQIGWHVYMPATMPFVVLGLRMAIPYSVIGVIVGEFTSSIHGLGLYISQSSSSFDPAGVFAGIIILLVFIFLASALASALERRLLVWQVSAAEPVREI